MTETRTATIVVTDLAGSTRLRAEVGEARADELRRAHDALLGEQANAHGGSVIKGLGDGLLVAFAGAAEALSAAVAMQQALHNYNEREATTLEMRVGVAAGDVAFEQGDCFGTPVIEAARLCAAAPAGSIYLADMVRLLARGRADLELVTVGPLELKGLPEPLDVSALRWEPVRRAAADLRTTAPYVGRERERETLQTAWRSAADGTGGLALIAGEPGIGKTRLVSEIAREAEAGGALVLMGGCHDGDVVAYAPFVEALTEWVRTGDPNDVESVLGHDAAVVGRLVPAIGETLADVGEPDAVSADAESARLRDALAQTLVRLSARTPVFLVVDDLHWADDATVGMLRVVSRAARTAHLFVVGTYRETDVDRRHPFAQALGVLQREVEPLRIALAGLDAADVQAFLERIAEHSVPEAFATMLATETEGNPFFLRETLLHLVDEGELRFTDGVWTLTRSLADLGIPAGVRDVIGRRLSRLSDTANKLLAVGALFEVSFPLPVAADVIELDEDDALDAVDEALQAGIVRASDEFDHYRFTHALFRHTLVEELNPSRQVRFHRAIAGALEKRLRGAPTPAEAAALARHFQRSAALPNAERGVPYAVVVADDAARRYARREEYDALGIALELLSEGDDRLVDLHRRRAEAAIFSELPGDTVLREAEQAADLIVATTGPDAACTFVAHLAGESFALDDVRTPWRLAALGRRWLAPDRRDAAYCTLRTFELAEREFNDPEHPGIPLDTPERRELLELVSGIPPSEFSSQFAFSPASRAQSKAYFEFARADLEAAGSTTVAPLLGPLFTMGECVTTRTILERAVADARQRGIAPSIAFNLALLSRWQNILGDFDAADASLAEGMALIPRISETSNATFQLYGSAALNARVRGVRLGVEMIDAFNQWDGSPNTRWAWMVVVAARGYALSFAGRVDEAMEVFREALPIVERAGGWAPNYLLLVDELVKTLWHTQRTDDIDVLERNLRAKVLEPDQRYPESDGRWAMALLCALDGRVDEATQWFAEARRVLGEQGTWPLLVDVDVDEARMHLRLGSRGDAARVAELIDAARSRCTHPAMAAWLERIDELSRD